MRYWWVNQNQTYRHEIGGGYLWSPKRKKDGSWHYYYETMRETSPGDVVLSYYDTHIAALGIVTSYGYQSPKPSEFGSAGLNWSDIGWKVETEFRELRNRVRPKDFMEKLVDHLPAKYSPLQPNGNGLQSVYLTEISAAFADVIFARIGGEATITLQLARELRKAETISPAPEPTLQEWERREETLVRESPVLDDTTREALIQARRGQGIFRKRVQEMEKACRVTRVDRVEHLIASHIRPWRDCQNDDRLNGENGLLLTPTVDHLFDKGFISFENTGSVIVSPVADPMSLHRMGIDPKAPPNVGTFSSGQHLFLDYHRENVLRMIRR